MSITSRINEMSTHIEQAYDELQGLGADLTNVNKNIENISMVLDDIYDSMPQVSGEGTSLTLDDTRVGKIKSTLKGNTSQESTTGINLFCPDAPSKTQNGITVTNNGDGTFTISGTATNNVAISLTTGSKGKELTGSQAYTLAVDIISNGGSRGSITCEIDKNGTIQYNFFSVAPEQATGMKIQVSTPSEDATIKDIAYYVANGLVVNNLKIRPYLVKGSYTASNVPDYEPYTNGASPNPDYPQDIHVVSGDNTIDIEGKNLFDKTTITENQRLDPNGGNNYDENCDLSDYIKIQPNTTYTRNITASVYECICFYTINKTFISRDTTHATTTSPNNAYYVRISCYKTNLDTLQFEKGSSASTYEPYVSSSYQVNLPIENILDITSSGSSIGGVPFTIENGIIKINGTTSSSTASYYFNTFRTKSESAMFSIEVTGYTDKSSGNSALILQQSDDGTTGWSTLSELSLNSVYAKQNSVTLDSSKYYRLRWYVDNNTFTNAKIKAQLEYGNKKNSFTPYGTTPIELCKIGNYQDYFYKDSGKWYLHKEIGKVVLNGSEAWTKSSNTNVNRYYIPGTFINTILNVSTIDLISDYFTCITPIQSDAYNVGLSKLNNTSIMVNFSLSDTSFDTLQKFKTWLSSHNVVVYYVLATPTNTEVEYQPLIDQLNLLEKAMSKDGQTNISQINNDLPFIISASALKEWQESTSLNSTLSMVNPLSLGNTLNTQENDIQPIEVDNIEPLEEEENEES